ncbi:carboxymuconolactone decarboxylase family protein [Achromobacter sp. UMC71]|uniref:carboxymuconolactone decarboxylase family protein n=1 Tax=Achromobacter sp. UMC71 TaxID=1862320 RepID=UPI0015FFFA7E|nr:carboxymuconolactone decarboxylase family protein [Achromobacter sp. UMC71]MBB1628327.1 carboxymuconolactone decarboxylase [Achromobacter sp. UMC71]
MARIPYPDLDASEIAPLVDRIKGERGKVLNLYSMLLHSPPVAEGWLSFLTAIRQKCSLSGRVRELVILRIALLNGAEYEFAAHRPFAIEEGMTDAQIDGLRAGKTDLFSDVDKAILAYCDSSTQGVHVPTDLFDAVKVHFNSRELVELTATIGAYNLVSRFLEAMQVDHEGREN